MFQSILFNLPGVPPCRLILQATCVNSARASLAHWQRTGFPREPIGQEANRLSRSLAWVPTSAATLQNSIFLRCEMCKLNDLVFRSRLSTREVGASGVTTTTRDACPGLEIRRRASPEGLQSYPDRPDPNLE